MYDTPTTNKVSHLYHSAAISYGGPDIEIARILHRFLTDSGVSVWFYPEDGLPGEKLHRMMTEMTNIADRVILLCSKSSLHREGVLNEIERTLERESKEGGSNILLPLALDEYVLSTWKPDRTDLALQIRSRNILKFGGNLNSAETAKTSMNLLHVLKKRLG